MDFPQENWFTELDLILLLLLVAEYCFTCLYWNRFGITFESLCQHLVAFLLVSFELTEGRPNLLFFHFEFGSRGIFIPLLLPPRKDSFNFLLEVCLVLLWHLDLSSDVVSNLIPHFDTIFYVIGLSTVALDKLVHPLARALNLKQLVVLVRVEQFLFFHVKGIARLGLQLHRRELFFSDLVEGNHVLDLSGESLHRIRLTREVFVL